MNGPADILMIEDNEADIVLVREALKESSVSNVLHVVRDGEQAMAFLRKDKALNPDGVRPGLVLLDLYLPKMDGKEILQAIKGDDSLKSIPVVIMTSSQEETDVTKAYNLQANSYIIKPVDYEQLIKVVETIEDFWLSVVKLPRN